MLLYCGDLDPKGLQMSDTLMSNLKELEGAVGWDPSGLVVDRFGLNLAFVEENDLSWVDNLITGSGKDLADPNHKEHKLDYVQDWLKKIGPRKVEANALVTRPDAGRQLCFDAITKYVDPDAPEIYREKVRIRQNEVRLTLDEMVPEAPWK